MQHTPTLKPPRHLPSSQQHPIFSPPQLQHSSPNEYRGITLKEYFQLGEPSNRPMAAIREDSSEQGDDPVTPQWPALEQSQRQPQKNHKTEAGEECPQPAKQL